MLTQQQANLLIAMPKRATEVKPYRYPGAGGRLNIPLKSLDDREHFLLDVNQAGVVLTKFTNQLRAQKVVPLVRLDVDGGPHQNPDEEWMPCPHLHVYREGFGMKWAQPVPSSLFRDLTDPMGTLKDFMEFCRIVVKPNVLPSLFSP